MSENIAIDVQQFFAATTGEDVATRKNRGWTLRVFFFR